MTRCTAALVKGLTLHSDTNFKSKKKLEYQMVSEGTYFTPSLQTIGLILTSNCLSNPSIVGLFQRWKQISALSSFTADLFKTLPSTSTPFPVSRCLKLIVSFTSIKLSHFATSLDDLPEGSLSQLISGSLFVLLVNIQSFNYN